MTVRVLSRNYRPTRVAGTKYDPKWSYIRAHTVGLWPFWERGSGILENWAHPGLLPSISKGTATEWRDMTNGPGLHFDGTGYVDTRSSRLSTVGLYVANNTELWTVVLRTRTPVGTTAGTMMARAGATPGSRTFYVAYGTSTATPLVELRGTQTLTNWGLADGAWHTIWIVSPAVGNVRGYYDNARGGINLGSGLIAEETAETIMFGARTTATPGNFYTGDIDFAAILDVPLQPSDLIHWNADLLAPWRPARRWGRGLAGPSAAVSGTATSSMQEGDVQLGGKTIILTLSSETWVAAGATFDAQRQAIINGITSNKAEANGWNALVRDVMAVTTVVRTSDTVVTITLPAAPLYAITAIETITVTVPGAALTLGNPLVASPTFTVGDTEEDSIMAWISGDRVKETSTTTGTGDVTLAGAVSGFQAFSAIASNLDRVAYAIVGTTEWETGVGTWNTGGTLSRTRVLQSSNAGALVNFSAGSKDVFCTFPAGHGILAASNMEQTTNVYIPDRSTVYVADEYEIAPSKECEVGPLSVLEIG